MQHGAIPRSPRPLGWHQTPGAGELGPSPPQHRKGVLGTKPLALVWPLCASHSAIWLLLPPPCPAGDIAGASPAPILPPASNKVPPNTSTAPPQHLVQGSGEGGGLGMRWPQLRGAGHKLQTQAIHSPNPAPAGPRWLGWGQFTPRCSGHPQANAEPPLNPPAFSSCWRKARCLAKAPRSRRKNRNKKEQRGREAPTAL